MSKFVTRFVKDESGATAIEYGLIAALVAVALVTALTALSGKISSLFGDIGAELDAAV
ncbi:Flp family type IVb pilin [Phenylobacterium sp.]|uniref:Flp family type IVb pilin n=1 Tax=Phenylobacterium sp. TaxID=1871053 RepID=UPI00286B71FA|nr:Flp family type IVb pilin [Phenylobacterium sp.]